MNNLVHSLPNIIHGDTLLNPAHYNSDKTRLQQFDYIVSNPPFKTDFSEYRNTTGFLFDEPMDILKGYYIYDFDDLVSFWLILKQASLNSSGQTHSTDAHFAFLLLLFL